MIPRRDVRCEKKIRGPGEMSPELSDLIVQYHSLVYVVLGCHLPGAAQEHHVVQRHPCLCPHDVHEHAFEHFVS